MKADVQKYLLGLYLQTSGTARRNRQRLYQGAHGLRIIAMHETRGPKQLDRLKHFVEFARKHFVMATPDDVTVLSAGQLGSTNKDRLLLTFDDGHADNFEAAQYLASQNLRAIFFVIPSFLGRNVPDYYEFHERHRVKAHRFAPHHRDSGGLSPTQIKEMASMGHLIAAHNYSHRNLGELHSEEDIRYEVQCALDDLSALLGKPCQDFAFGFGHARHLSAEAAKYLKQHCGRTYACVRGLNIPGKSPCFFLRDGIGLLHPFNFTAAAVRGALDHRYVHQWMELAQLSGLLPAAVATS